MSAVTSETAPVSRAGMFDLSGQVALAAAGALVVLNSCDAATLDRRQAELAGWELVGDVAASDVADAEAVARSVAAIGARHGRLDVVLASGRAQTFNPAVFTRLGIELAAKKIVAVKSSNHFHAAFAPIAAGIIYIDCGGPYPPDPARIAYTQIRRPIAPLDPNRWFG